MFRKVSGSPRFHPQTNFYTRRIKFIVKFDHYLFSKFNGYIPVTVVRPKVIVTHFLRNSPYLVHFRRIIHIDHFFTQQRTIAFIIFGPEIFTNNYIAIL